MEETRPRSHYIFALMKHVKGFSWFLLASILSKLLYKIVPLLISVLASYAVSTALMGDAHRVVSLGVGIGICVLLNTLFSFLDIYVSHDMSYRILTKLRDKAYDKIDEIAPAATEGKRSGDFISTILNDIEFFEWFYAHILTEWMVVGVITVSALVFMGSFSPVLPSVVLPFILLILAIPKVLAKKADKQGKAVRDTAGIMNAVVIDGIQGLKDIISYRWQKEYFNRFFASVEDCSNAEIAYTKRGANEKRLMNAAMEVASLCTTVCIVMLVVNGALDSVWLMPMFTLAYAVFSPMQDALGLSTNYGFVYGAAKRVFDLFQTQPKVHDSGRKAAGDVYAGGDCRVKFAGVRFSYPASKDEARNPDVLRDLTFDVTTGETVALVAASGGGKTTTARLLQRFWDIDAGAIQINGTDIRELRIEGLRDIVTVVPQDVYLFNETVTENLRQAKADASEEEIHSACVNAQADAFIQSLPDGYNTRIGERGLRLSGGEKQRLSIAQAFLKNAPVLVLDEASASLDSENERLINTAVNRLKKDRATIVIAHRLSTMKNADRIVFIQNGTVSGQGTYETLLAGNDEFRDLVGAMSRDAH